MAGMQTRGGLDGGYHVVLLILLFAVSSGCMSQQLALTARRTVGALPDLNYQQAIDNLAKLACNPGLLPSLAVVGQGSVQVTDNGNSSLAMNLSAQTFGTGMLGLGASRNVTGTWSLGTITNPEKIVSMRSVYQNAIRARAAGDPAFGWLKTGGKKDVPRQASYVGRFGDTFVWVMPEGMDGLSDLTLAIMDIATRDDSAPGPRVVGGPMRDASGPPGVSRRNFQVAPVGPVFTPNTP